MHNNEQQKDEVIAIALEARKLELPTRPPAEIQQVRQKDQQVVEMVDRSDWLARFAERQSVI